MNKPTIEQKWRRQIEEVKTEARKLHHSRERDALLETARQLETASYISEWLSPEVQPPR
jgi:hypothetical protein